MAWPKGKPRKPIETEMTEAEIPTESMPDTLPKPRKFPVTLLRNYVPKSGDADVIRPDDPDEPFREPTPMAHDVRRGEKPNYKIWAGTKVMLPIDEAEMLIARRLAERADAIRG